MADTQYQRPIVDGRSLWIGGVATALVAALVAIVGGLLATAIAHVLLLYAPRPPAFLGHTLSSGFSRARIQVRCRPAVQTSSPRATAR